MIPESVFILKDGSRARRHVLGGGKGLWLQDVLKRRMLGRNRVLTRDPPQWPRASTLPDRSHLLVRRRRRHLCFDTRRLRYGLSLQA